MQKLTNSVQSYTWGSKTALTEPYSMENLSSQSIAELRMGAYPENSSRAHDTAGDVVSLRGAIENDKATLLGDAAARRFGELLFLFRVLYVVQPFPIQAHPDKHNSEIGFAKENAVGILMDAAERNYKDPNRKPELALALTPFPAMNAFREFPEIVSLLQSATGIHLAIAYLLQQPDAECLNEPFASLPNMQGEEKSRVLAILKPASDSQQGESW